MLFPLLLTVALQASPRELYEQKCLYCHSEEVTEDKKRTVGQWRKLIGRMRAKAPVLITRSDVWVLTDYLTRTLKLVPPAGPKPPPPPVDPLKPPLTPPPLATAPDLQPEPEVLDEPPPPPPQVAQAQQQEDEEGADLMRRRCSKCHTLVRVFGKLDSYERSLFTLRRMRLKTGSGITRDDAERIEQFLKTQFGIAQ